MIPSLPLQVLYRSPAKAGFNSFWGAVIPGLRSLRSFTRGYQYAAPPALVESITEPRTVARGC